MEVKTSLQYNVCSIQCLVFAYRIRKFYKKFLGLHTHIYIYIDISIYLSIDRFSQIKKPLEKYFLCSFLSKKIYKLF